MARPNFSIFVPDQLRFDAVGCFGNERAQLRGDTFAQGVTRQSTTRFGFEVQPRMMFMRSPYEPDHRLARVFYHGLREEPGVALDFDGAVVQTAEHWLGEGMPEPFVL
jgi:hypothetical protein